MKVKSRFAYWLALVAVGLGLVVFGYAAAQQTMRLAANQPQQQLAEDAAARLEAGASTADVTTGSRQVDVVHSLAPFIVVTDKNAQVVASSGKLDSSLPLPPPSTFATARSKENWFTWQPKEGVREATVIVPYKDGFVLAARSLRDVEQNYNTLDRLVLLTALGILVAPGVILLVLP